MNFTGIDRGVPGKLCKATFIINGEKSFQKVLAAPEYWRFVQYSSFYKKQTHSLGKLWGMGRAYGARENRLFCFLNKSICGKWKLTKLPCLEKLQNFGMITMYKCVCAVSLSFPALCLRNLLSPLFTKMWRFYFLISHLVRLEHIILNRKSCKIIDYLTQSNLLSAKHCKAYFLFQ